MIQKYKNFIFRNKGLLSLELIAMLNQMNQGKLINTGGLNVDKQLWASF